MSMYKGKHGEWWLERQDKTWLKWDKKSNVWQEFEDNKWTNVAPTSTLPPPRSRLMSHSERAGSAGSPLLPLTIGATAVLIALLASLLVVVLGDATTDNVAKVLAPVVAVIATFTGHAAGHAAATHRGTSSNASGASHAGTPRP
jgi:hypothetical protein